MRLLEARTLLTDGFIVGGSCSRAKTWLANALSVVKSGGKEVSHIEKTAIYTALVAMDTVEKT